MLITREYLSQYTYLDSQIKRMHRQMKKYKERKSHTVHGVVSGSMANHPFMERHIVVSGSEISIKSDEERKQKINQLLVELKSNEQLYEDMKLDIELFIEEIKDLEVKTIFQRKYVDGATDTEIGNELGYERSTISKKIDKFLNNIALSHNSHL